MASCASGYNASVHWTSTALTSHFFGASIAEIMRVTQWQPHTVRGFISRALVHDLGLKVARFKRDQGQPAYRLPR